MNFLRELALTAVFFVVLQLVISPLIHSRMMNKWTMIPAMAFAGALAATAIAYVQFTPFLLGLAMLGGTYHTLKVMTEEPFQIKHRQACGKPPKMALYRTSSYLYVVIACVGGWLLQAQLIDGSGRSVNLWARLFGIQ